MWSIPRSAAIVYFTGVTAWAGWEIAQTILDNKLQEQEPWYRLLDTVVHLHGDDLAPRMITIGITMMAAMHFGGIMSSLYQGIANLIAGKERIARNQEIRDKLQRLKKAEKEAKKLREESETAKKQTELALEQLEAANERTESANKQAEAAEKQAADLQEAWSNWHKEQQQAKAEGREFDTPPPIPGG